MEDAAKVYAEGETLLKLLDEREAERAAAARFGVTLTLKESTDGKVTVTGLASSGAVDRMGDIVEQAGMVANLPVPFLLSHDHGAPIGTVTEARITPRGIAMTAICHRGVSDRIDEAIKLIKLGLYPGLSIGFRSIKAERLKAPATGWRFLEWELLEISACSVPANQDARITAAKRYPQVRLEAPERGKIMRVWS